jgi:osmoprotectant transport system substrate-binding protein
MRRRTLIAALGLILTLLVSARSASAQMVVVGGKNFTEQLLVAEMTKQLLSAKGFSTLLRMGFSTPGIRKEQEAGLIDVYWEYTGTSLLTFNNIRETLGPEETYARVKDLDAKKGLIWLSPSRVDNTYALAMRRSDAAARGIATISDLAARYRQGESLRFACNTEFYLRADGLMPLQRAYRFAFGLEDVIRVDTGAIYDVLREGRGVDIGLVFATDGRIAAYDLIVLEDDQRFFPSYLLTPVIRRSVLERQPGIADHLNALSARLDNATMTALNAQVDIEKRPVEDVAVLFLRAVGLI